MPTARLACQKAGYDLVNVETPEEHECVREFIKMKRMIHIQAEEQNLKFITLANKGDHDVFVYTGLNAINKVYYTHWSNGANVSYDGWRTGQPTQWDKGEKCMIYWYAYN
jgi:Lectin C-type domain